MTSEEKKRQQHDLWEALNELEASFHQEGYQEIAGVDEAGRGPLRPRGGRRGHPRSRPPSTA